MSRRNSTNFNLINLDYIFQDDPLSL